MLGDRDEYYAMCKPLIDRVKNGEKVAVVSYLVILEAIHVLRRRTIAKSEFGGSGRDEYNKNISTAKTLVRGFMSEIYKLSEEKKIIIAIHDKTTLHHHHRTTMKKLNSYFGYVRTVSVCPYCEQGRVGRRGNNACPSCNANHKPISKYQYKALGHADIEHAYLATYSSVSLFYSTDTSW